MLSISNALKKQSVSGAAAPACKVKIKLKSGKELVLTQSDLWEGGFSMDDATSGSGSFDIGQVITNRLKLNLDDSEEQYSVYDFLDAEATAWRGGILQDGTTELLQCGSFLVQEQSNPDSSVDLTCLDNMCKTEIPYSEVSTVYPATIQVIVQDICNRCGITLATTQIDNGGYVVSERPNDEALTCRDVLHYAAQISGSFARCDALGRMELRWYNEKATKHKITAIKSFTPENQDIIITGIQATDASDEKQSSLYGEKGYVLEVSDNPLIEAGKAPVVASYLGKKIIGMSFRPLDLTCILDPSAEAGDPAEVTDRKGKTYTCWITNMTYATGRDTKITCDAESPSDRAAVRFSEQTKAIIENRNKIEKERTERELALKNLSKQLAESSGMYITAEKQKDGSTIYYVHDKSTLAESMVVWKLTATALGISTDGGKTYPYGLDVSGDAILNRIYVNGIDGKYIKIENEKLSEYVEKVNKTASDASDTAEKAMRTANSTVASMTVEYYKSTSSTELKGGTWQSGAVTATQGYYIWSRTKTVAQDDTVTYSQAACITGSTGATGAKGDTGATGEKGDTGATGKGVKSIVPQYYLSTSSTTQAGGTWANTQPAWQPNHYLWTRSYITWSDNTSSTTTPILAQALNDANEKGYNNSQELETVKETVTKQGSSLTTMENQIKEKVWKEDITTEVKKISVGARNLARGQSREWQSFQPATGVNQCHSFLKSGTTANIDTSASAGLSVTCTVELRWEKCASQSGQTMKVWAQGSQDGAWTSSNPFCNGLFNFAPTASGQQIFKTTATWDGKAHRYDIGMRCDYSDGNGIFYWRCLKAEIGNVSTDWTPAPEDVQSDIDTAQSTADGVRTTVTQTRTEVEALKTSTESLTTAMREYTKITDFEAYKKQVSSQLSQTPEAITARFNTIEETVSKQGEASNSKWQELENYIQFSSAGITLGKKNDPLTLVLDNGQICFMQSGQKVAWFTNNQLYISNVAVTTAATIVGLQISRHGRHIQIS
jgi:hypothetical protein